MQEQLDGGPSAYPPMLVLSFLRPQFCCNGTYGQRQQRILYVGCGADAEHKVATDSKTAYVMHMLLVRFGLPRPHQVDGIRQLRTGVKLLLTK